MRAHGPLLRRGGPRARPARRVRPQVLRVVGTCREAVEVRGFEDLRIVAAPGAALESVPGATAYPLAVFASRSVTIEGLTVRVTSSRHKVPASTISPWRRWRAL